MDKNSCTKILNKYNIDYIDIKGIKNGSFETKINDNKTLIIKNENEKEKIAWEYKTLLNLKNKLRVPEIFKVNDEYITECSVIEKIDGKNIETYEDKIGSAFWLGEALGLLHISEINEQSSEEELKKIWQQHILSKTLYYGTKIISLFSKEFNDKIFNYLNENMHYVKEDYEISMLIGKLTNDDYVVKDERVYFNNYDNSIVGDAIYDFAMIYDYYYDNKEMLYSFLQGYKEYNSIPDNFEMKMPFYKFIVSLDKLVELSEDKDNNKEQIDILLDIINAIMDDKYNIFVEDEE